MIKIGHKVIVSSRIGNPDQKATVVDIIPGNEYRETMYRVRFPHDPSVVTITPNPNECWVDAPLVSPELTNSYDVEMLVEWEKTQKILDERYPRYSGN